MNKRIIILKTLIVFWCSVSGQNMNPTAIIEPFKLDGEIIGKAEFQYKKVNRDTIKDGQFDFTSVYQRVPHDSIGRTTVINISGIYSNGKKDQNWRYRVRELVPILSSPSLAPNGIELIFPTQGKESILNATYINGIPTDSWYGIRFLIDQSERIDTNLQVTLHIIANNIQDFSFLNPKKMINIQGNISRNLINKDLVVNHKKGDDHYLSNLTFSEGVPSKIVITKNNQLIYSRSYKTDKEHFQEIFLEEYLSLLITIDEDLYDNPEHVELFELIKSNFEEGSDLIFNPLFNSGITSSKSVSDLNIPKVKIAVSDPKEGRNDDLMKVDSFIQSIKSKTTALLEDRKFSLERFKSDELAKQFKIVNEIEENIEYLDTYRLLFENKYKDYIDFDRKTVILSEKLFKTDTLSYVLNDEKIVFQFDFPRINTQRSFPGNILQFLTEVDSILIRAAKVSNVVYEEIELLKLIEQKEKSLLELHKNLMKNIESSEPTSNIIGVDFIFTTLSGYIDKQMSIYATLEETDKLNFAETLNTCFTEINTGVNILKNQSEQMQMIDAKYSESNLNPFTFEYQTDRIYPRLYSAYIDKLLPHIIKNIKENISCNEFLSYVEDIQILNQYMIKIADERNSSPDRAIRKNNSAGQIITKLNIGIQI
jgi:hypothetical protein